ncbi:PREDICTED: uncharacterized protein LOC101294069 [Fragaria vesca subsp. vesca]
MTRVQAIIGVVGLCGLFRVSPNTTVRGGADRLLFTDESHVNAKRRPVASPRFDSRRRRSASPISSSALRFRFRGADAAFDSIGMSDADSEFVVAEEHERCG